MIAGSYCLTATCDPSVSPNPPAQINNKETSTHPVIYKLSTQQGAKQKSICIPLLTPHSDFLSLRWPPLLGPCKPGVEKSHGNTGDLRVIWGHICGPGRSPGATCMGRRELYVKPGARAQWGWVRSYIHGARPWYKWPRMPGIKAGV